MSENNPKSHDSLMKWMIVSFFEEFFAHYFPGITIGKYTFIDKEFISKYEALKESLKGDLFLMMEIEADGEPCELAIQIEHQSDKKDVSGRMFEYLCYVWLMKKKPVWSIVFYTDDASWKKRVPGKFCYAFDPEHRQQFFHFSVIKLKDEKSRDLIKKHSLLCKLLALKADDKGADTEEMLSEIYRTVAEMKEGLSNERLLLIKQWTDLYRKDVSEETLDRIRKEHGMAIIETTITEHIFNQGAKKGKVEGRIEGKIEGQIEGQITMLESLHKQGILSKKKMEKMIAPLRQKLEELYAQLSKAA